MLSSEETVELELFIDSACKNASYPVKNDESAQYSDCLLFPTLRGRNADFQSGLAHDQVECLSPIKI